MSRTKKTARMSTTPISIHPNSHPQSNSNKQTERPKINPIALITDINNSVSSIVHQEIFSRINYKDLLINLALVNKDFRKVVLSGKTKKFLDAYQKKVTDVQESHWDNYHLNIFRCAIQFNRTVDASISFAGIFRDGERSLTKNRILECLKLVLANRRLDILCEIMDKDKAKGQDGNMWDYVKATVDLDPPYDDTISLCVVPYENTLFTFIREWKDERIFPMNIEGRTDSRDLPRKIHIYRSIIEDKMEFEITLGRLSLHLPINREFLDFATKNYLICAAAKFGDNELFTKMIEKTKGECIRANTFACIMTYGTEFHVRYIRDNYFAQLFGRDFRNGFFFKSTVTRKYQFPKNYTVTAFVTGFEAAAVNGNYQLLQAFFEDIEGTPQITDCYWNAICHKSLFCRAAHSLEVIKTVARFFTINHWVIVAKDAIMCRNMRVAKFAFTGLGSYEHAMEIFMDYAIDYYPSPDNTQFLEELLSYIIQHGLFSNPVITLFQKELFQKLNDMREEVASTRVSSVQFWCKKMGEIYLMHEKTLTKIPEDVTRIILSNVNFFDLPRLATTCKKFNLMINSNNSDDPLACRVITHRDIRKIFDTNKKLANALKIQDETFAGLNGKKIPICMHEEELLHYMKLHSDSPDVLGIQSHTRAMAAYFAAVNGNARWLEYLLYRYPHKKEPVKMKSSEIGQALYYVVAGKYTEELKILVKALNDCTIVELGFSNMDTWERDQVSTHRFWPAYSQTYLENASKEAVSVNQNNARAALETVEILLDLVRDNDDETTTLACMEKRALVSACKYCNFAILEKFSHYLSDCDPSSGKWESDIPHKCAKSCANAVFDECKKEERLNFFNKFISYIPREQRDTVYSLMYDYVLERLYDSDKDVQTLQWLVREGYKFDCDNGLNYAITELLPKKAIFFAFLGASKEALQKAYYQSSMKKGTSYAEKIFLFLHQLIYKEGNNDEGLAISLGDISRMVFFIQRGVSKESYRLALKYATYMNANGSESRIPRDIIKAARRQWKETHEQSEEMQISTEGSSSKKRKASDDLVDNSD